MRDIFLPQESIKNSSPSPFTNNSGTQPSQLPASEKPKKRRWEGFRGTFSTVLILLLAPLIALVLTAFVFQSYEVDGPSMETTLQNQDRLIVLKVPRTWAKITGNPYIPNRGDIIVFSRNEGAQFSGPLEKQLIKRVIGLPGDRVVVKDGTITVYNNENPGGFNPDKTLPYGENVASVTPGNVDITVKEGELFVCGDNRPNSLDSRTFGPIRAGDVVGKLGLRIFPIGNAEVF